MYFIRNAKNEVADTKFELTKLKFIVIAERSEAERGLVIVT